MKSTLLASGLGFPEGPVVTGDGRIVLCDGNTGDLLAYADGTVSAYAHTGGSPRGTVLGSDGAIYVTQAATCPAAATPARRQGYSGCSPTGRSSCCSPRWRPSSAAAAASASCPSASRSVNLPNGTQLWATIDMFPVGIITTSHGSGSMTSYNLGDFAPSMDQVTIFN